MKFNIHAGHNPDGKIASGAVGFIKESTEARNVKKKLIGMLRDMGHTAYDCTVDNGAGQSDVLDKIVKKCNSHKVDLDVSIHFNSGANDKKGDGKRTGVEVFVYSSKSKAKTAAERVCREIAKLGFKERGVKYSKSLRVLRRTNSPAMLVECCFVDDKDDAELYNSTKMAGAIACGLLGKQYAVKDAEKKECDPKNKKPAYQAKVTASSLNVRTGPGTRYKIADTLKKGETVTIIEKQGNWGKLKGAGWVSLSYTKKV